MNNYSEILLLKQFRLREKFSLEDWIRIGFVPSKFSKLKQLEDYINTCIEDILLRPEIPAIRKKIFSHYLCELEKLELNYQERLLAYIYLNELARICSIDLERKLDQWLFGFRGLLFYYLKPLFYTRRKKLKELMSNTSLQFENYFEIVRKKAILVDEIRL